MVKAAVDGSLTSFNFLNVNAFKQYTGNLVT